MAAIRYYWELVLYACTGAWAWAQWVAGVFALVGGLIVWRYSKWESKMKNLFWVIPLFVFALLLLMRLIWAPYAIHADDQRQISHLTQALTQREQDTRQTVRSFLESLSPEILAKVDDGQKEIGVWLNTISQAKLATLTALPDLDKFLSFEDTGDVSVGGPGVHPGGPYLHPSAENGQLNGYYLYPKDALIKAQ